MWLDSIKSMQTLRLAFSETTASIQADEREAEGKKKFTETL